MDLYLLHRPVPKLIVESWRAMERLLDENRVRAIGVSNVRICELDRGQRFNVDPDAAIEANIQTRVPN